jgi:N-acetylglucosamine-6-phosphate deacetylase
MRTYSHRGRIAVGLRADLVLLHANLDIAHTVVAGVVMA